MAEFRSFIIGVVVATAIIGAGALVFGAFGSEGRGPEAVLISTPPATRTPQLGTVATRAASQTPELGLRRTPASNGAGTQSTVVVANTVAPTATSGPAQATSTPGATSTPEPTATQEPDDDYEDYVANVNSLAASLTAQLAYLTDRANAPNTADATWKDFTILAAQNVRSLGGQLVSLSAPSCASSAHSSLVSGVNQGISAADAIMAAANSGDAAAASATASSFSASRSAVNQAVSAVEGADC